MDESTSTSFRSGFVGKVLVRQATKPSGRTSTAPSGDTSNFARQPSSRSSTSPSAAMRHTASSIPRELEIEGLPTGHELHGEGSGISC